MALLVGVCAGAAFAEEHRLSLPDALRLVRDNSLLLQVQDLQVAAKKRSKDFAWNSFIPRAGITSTLSRLNAAPTNPFSALAGVSGIPAEMTADPAHTWNVGLGLSAQLDISLALFDGIRHMALDYEAGLISHKTAEAGLMRDVKKSYYNLIVLQENRRILEQSVETARKHFEQAQRNYRTGIGSEFEVLSAQVGWESLKPSLEELRVGYQSAELAFKQLLGLKRADTLALTDPLLARTSHKTWFSLPLAGDGSAALII
jgi:outer membrane protein TolC